MPRIDDLRRVWLTDLDSAAVGILWGVWALTHESFETGPAWSELRALPEHFWGWLVLLAACFQLVSVIRPTPTRRRLAAAIMAVLFGTIGFAFKEGLPASPSWVAYFGYMLINGCIFIHLHD